MNRIDEVFLHRNKLLSKFYWLIFAIVALMLIPNFTWALLGITIAVFAMCVFIMISNRKRLIIRKVPYVTLIFTIATSIYTTTSSPDTFYATSFLSLALLMLYPNYRLTLIYGTATMAFQLYDDIDAGFGIGDILSNDVTRLLTYALFVFVAVLNEKLFLNAEKRTGEAMTASAKVESVLKEMRNAASTLTAFSKQLRENVSQTGKLSGEVTLGFGEVAKGVDTQAAGIADINDNVSLNNEHIEVVAANATVMKEISAHTAEFTEQGREQVEDLTEQMFKVDADMEDLVASMAVLNRQSEQIEAMLQTVADMADQTNLLALNAAIEAARAGEQGRGFAVVSNEVRKLAENSRSSAEEIRSIVSDIQKTCVSLTEQVGTSKSAIDRSKQSVIMSRQLLEQIADNTRDVVNQAVIVEEKTTLIQRSSETIVDEVSNISSITQQSSASVEQILASMEEQRQMVDSIVRSFEELDVLVQNLNSLTAANE